MSVSESLASALRGPRRTAAGTEDSSPSGGPVLHAVGRASAHVVAILAVAAMMSAPALWNGYPFLYHDTEDYVTTSFTWDPPLWRIGTYALVVAVARPFGTLWAVVAVQSVFAAWMLHETVCAFLPRHRLKALLLLAILLAASSAMPWMASQIMPDAFTAFVPLGAATLAFGTGLGRWRRAGVALGVAVAVVVHLSHVAVAVGLLAVVLAMRMMSRRIDWVPRPALGLVASAVIAGILAIPAVHYAMTGSAFLSRGGRILQLALLVQEGIAKKYLDAVCPKGADLALCPYRNRLPDTANAFLWAPWASPFWKLGGWAGMRDEADRIVAGAIRDFPGEVAAAALENAWSQYWSIALGDGWGPKNRPRWAGEYYDVGKARYPEDFPSYMAAQQQTGKGIDFEPINAYQVPFAVLGRALLVVLTIFAFSRADKEGAGLGALVLLALIGNAFICGALSNPHDRYQNRIVWNAAAVSFLLLGRQMLRRQAGRRAEEVSLLPPVRVGQVPQRSGVMRRW